MPFVKLDCKILDKSIWRASPETKIVWITILAMADSDGLVEAAIPGIADRAKVSLEKTEVAMNTFQAPDKWSSNQDHEGRRIERVKEGFQILNYQQYRDKDYTAAARVKRYRECLRVTGVTKRSEYIYASEVLSYLNLKTGRKYRSFKEIVPRLNEGHSVEDFKKIIDVKLLDPYFIENPHYLNPETLFRKSHFDKYLNQRPADFNGNGKSTFRRPDPGAPRHSPELTDAQENERTIARLKIKIAEFESHEIAGNLDGQSLKKLADWRDELKTLIGDQNEI
jgi:uncharacterized phage protein (TIGR02220 family)